MTYSRQEGLFYGGECRLSFKPNSTNRLFSRVPADPDLLDEMMCGPYNRKGLMCGKCTDGYGSGVLNAKCVDCSKLSMDSAICLYLLVDFVPTLLYFVAERLSARHLIVQHALGRCGQCMLSGTLFYACAGGAGHADHAMDPGPSVRQSARVAALEETAEDARKADRERKKRSRSEESSKIR